MTRRFLAACLAAAVALLPLPAYASDCSRTSVGFVPLTDLGPGLYQGEMGGLYPGGANVRPPGHDAAGVAIAGSIVPLDTLGNADAAGRIVLISIGMSNATQEFSAFVPKAMSDPARNPNVLAIDCAQGGQAAGDINSPSAPYWNTVFSRLRLAGSSPLQAQAVWLIEAQIAGVDSLNFDAASGPVEAPWLAWGPYLWADGLNAQSDGLTWQCSEFMSDGTHPSESGRSVVADSLLAFFTRDAWVQVGGD